MKTKIKAKSVHISDLEFHKKLKIKATELSITIEQLVINLFNEKFKNRDK